MAVRYTNGLLSGLMFNDRPGDCPDHRIGRDVFHYHIAALTVARVANKQAGSKVQRVAVIDHHFHVVPVSRNGVS